MFALHHQQILLSPVIGAAQADGWLILPNMQVDRQTYLHIAQQMRLFPVIGAAQAFKHAD